MSEPIISVSGLRGIVGESLTPLVAASYVAAFASTLKPGPVVVSRDGRSSGPMLAQIVCGTLAACGRRVLYADVAATPTLGVMVRAHLAAGGVQISASHNPPPYNGLKLFNTDGRVLPSAEGKAALEAYRASASPWVTADQISGNQQIGDTVGQHVSLILATVDVETIRTKRFRVLLDSNAGAGSLMGQRLLSALGCEITLLGGQPTGRFEHPPEPTAENLAGVGEKVRAANAQVGFCQDPDADRLAIIDETGRYIGEEYSLALCLDHVLREHKGPVVTNCATSRMAEDLAAKYGVPFHRSAVGEANVVDKMLAVGAVFGGEGNGGPIDPRVGYVRDSFVGMALVLAAVAQRQRKVSELADELPRYSIVKRTASLPQIRLPAALDAVQKHFSDARPDRLDGLRLDWPDRWLIVRGSNTEPIVRIIAEAPTAAAAEELVAAACDCLSQV
ncbi:MAG TPA: phosphoglucosamine mutase [Pirellulaceae bacterium]|nr:phosphoglucosamine mutase [Pirellulaceae bacterium]